MDVKMLRDLDFDPEDGEIELLPEALKVLLGEVEATRDNPITITVGEIKPVDLERSAAIAAQYDSEVNEGFDPRDVPTMDPQEEGRLYEESGNYLVLYVEGGSEEVLLFVEPGNESIGWADGELENLQAAYAILAPTLRWTLVGDDVEHEPRDEGGLTKGIFRWQGLDPGEYQLRLVVDEAKLNAALAALG